MRRLKNKIKEKLGKQHEVEDGKQCSQPQHTEQSVDDSSTRRASASTSEPDAVAKPDLCQQDSIGDFNKDSQLKQTEQSVDDSSMNPASKPISKPDPPAKPDLWQRAFDALDFEKQQLIKSISIAKSDKIIDPNDLDVKIGVVDRLNILNDVVDTVKTQYEIDQAKSKIREPAQKIITSVLGFQDLIKAAVGFDPTGHATSAWAIVSLGLNLGVSPFFMKSQ